MIGKTISHYKILEELGRGGMGVVYLAEDMKLDRKVALKFLAPGALGGTEEKARFAHEAKAAAALAHPNICTIHEIDEYEGQSFIAMEYVEGESLKSMIEKGPLAIEYVMDIGMQLAAGLQEAHEKGIIHRDIKPANIMITSKDRIKIMDFGLAKLRGKTMLTKEGTTLGTVSYMSPEQARGDEVDSRTDIWSLGVVLYEMITGRMPFKGEYEQAVIYSILNDVPAPPTALRTDVPIELERVMLKCLAKDLDERYRHTDEIIVDLRRILRRMKSGNRSVKGISESYGIKAGRDNRRIPWSIIAVIVVAVVVALIVVGRQYLFERGGKVINSIAVLPLDNLSGDPEQEYFADGMTEALITELSRIKALKVISRTSVMRFKDTDKSLREIARELDVAAVVEGSAMLVGDKVRITAQLIEAATDHHIWANDYERDFEDVIALQKEVARTIAREVQVAVTPEEEANLARARQVDSDAQVLYLKGLRLIKQFGAEPQYKAIEYFQQAISIDSSFALAYVGVSHAYNILVPYAQDMKQEYKMESKRWAEKALAIDGSLGLAYALIADYRYMNEWDFVGAEEYFKRAVELSPGNAIVHSWYGYFLLCMRRHEEAIAEARRSRQLDPMGIKLGTNEAYFLVFSGEFDLAEQVVEELFEMGIEEGILHILMSMIYVETGRYEEALEEIDKSEEMMGDDALPYERAYYYAKMGRNDAARKILDEILTIPEKNERLIRIIIMTSVALGDMDLAFEWLERAYDERYDFVIFQNGMKSLDTLRNDPRYHDLMKKIGLET